MKIDGNYFEPRSSRSHHARMSVRNSGIRIEFEDGRRTGILDVDHIQGNRDVNFIGGAYFRSEGNLPSEFILRFQNSMQRKISWLEKFTFSRMAVLLLLVVVAVVVFRLAFESIESVAVHVFPTDWEERIGHQAYEDIKFLAFSDSKLPAGYQSDIRASAYLMIRAAGLSRQPKIYFHSSELLGPNAIAFPGGPIVVTDELVELLANPEEVLAVIAHELAHIELRHSLRGVIDVVGFSILVVLLFGADESVIEEMAAIAAGVVTLEGRRNYEKEADLAAIEYLSSIGRDPRNMLNVITKLSAYFCAAAEGDSIMDCESEGLNWFSTHPTDADRIAYLEEAIYGQ